MRLSLLLLLLFLCVLIDFLLSFSWLLISFPMQRLSEEMETMRSAKHSTELELSQTIVRYQLEIEEYHSRYVLLELELQAAKSYIDERKAVDIETANLALELEREKGRLAGKKPSARPVCRHIIH